MNAPGVVANPCEPQFRLCDLRLNEDDKLHNKVREILWCGADYIIYRTCKGVFVHFADEPEAQKRQRQAFNEICPELCELRFLTNEMQDKRKRWRVFRRLFRLSGEADGSADTLFEHNMAQAIMLLMEHDRKQAKAIAEAALEMAVTRVTNDNTIRYVMASFGAAFLFAVLFIPIIVVLGMPDAAGPADGKSASPYLVAALFGVLGAAFSVFTRVQSFRMKPCQQSNMNYLMACIRIVIGLIAGSMLYLAVGQPLSIVRIDPDLVQTWQAVALLGFLGGFAERLVPTVFGHAAAALEDSSGTPVQAVRHSDEDDHGGEKRGQSQ
jgi:hypothetical protein